MIRDMSREVFTSPNSVRGALYHEKIEVSSGTYSDVIILPITRVYSIAVQITGDGIIEFSNDSIADLMADQAEFTAWNGTDVIQTGVVAFRVTRNTGTVVTKVAVKTDTE